jgi:hypothetical protein
MIRKPPPGLPGGLPDPATLSELFATRLKQQESLSPRREEWQNRGAVLAWFEPWMVAAVEDDREWVAFQRADTEVVSGANPRIRRVTEPVRRAAFRRLKADRLRQVRAELPGAPEGDPTQMVLDAALRGERIGATQLAKLEREELDALQLVANWLDGIEGTGLPDRSLIGAQLARRDLFGPLQRVSANFVFTGRANELERLRLYIDGFKGSDLIASPLAAANMLGRQLMVVHGPGGVGKSTLIAQYLIQRTSSGLPFVYLDLDRHSLNPANALSLLIEALDQLVLQVNAVSEQSAGLRADFSRWMQERRSSRSSSAEVVHWITACTGRLRLSQR